MLAKKLLSVWHLKYFLLTSFIPLFSLNVLGKSVLIVMATISTALDWRLCRLMKSSLHTIAAALPSEVGLKRERKEEEVKITQQNNGIKGYKTKIRHYDSIKLYSIIV